MQITTFGIAVTLICLPIAAADTDSLPPADEILDRFVRVTGGAAYSRIRNRRETVELRVSFQKETADCVHETAFPNQVRGQVVSPDASDSLYGFDGDNAWLMTPSGPSWTTGVALKWEG
jgi:hypothetical protein